MRILFEMDNALIREVLEETGLCVIRDSIQEYGQVHRMHSLNAGLQPIWYIGAVDLPHTVDKNILTVKIWSEIERYVEG